MLQVHYQSLRPLATAHLAQTMSLLSLTAGELRQQIDSELAGNPALELVDERRCPTCGRVLPGRGACPACSQPKRTSADEPIVFVSPREISYGGSGASEDDQPEDRYSSAGEELPVYVFRQIAPDLAAEDRKLAAHLLANLDEDGLLSITLLDAARYLHVPMARVERVQRLIQHADPLGVGSASTQEALLMQLEILAETRPVPALAEMIVRRGMSLLSRHQFVELARQLKASPGKVQEAARFISENLNPYPARSSWGETHMGEGRSGREPNQVYYQPDMIISLQSDRMGDVTKLPLVVEVIMPLWGTLPIRSD
jgi:RNA polymerase sigma-54 factor